MVSYYTPYQNQTTAYNQDFSCGTEYISITNQELVMSFTNQGSVKDIEGASSMVRQYGLGWLLPLLGQFSPRISGIIKKIVIYTRKYAGNWPSGFV